MSEIFRLILKTVFSGLSETFDYCDPKDYNN